MAVATTLRSGIWILIASAVPALGSAGPSQNAIQDSSFRVGRWDGSAYARPDGSFDHCAAISSQPKSTLLVFSGNADGSFYIGFMHAPWKLAVGKTYRVSLALDGKSWGPQEALTVNVDTIQIGPLNPERLTALRVGYELALKAGGDSLFTSLEDSRRAMDAVTQCVARFQPDLRENAAAANSSNRLGDEPQNDSARQTRELVSNLLEKAGLAGTSWVDVASVGYKSAVLGWRSNTVEGALYVKHGDMSQMANDLRTKNAQACTGTFIATKPVLEPAGESDVKSYEFICEEGETTSGYAIVEVEDHKGKENLMFVNDANGKVNVTSLISANEKLRKMLMYLNKPDT